MAAEYPYMYRWGNIEKRRKFKGRRCKALGFGAMNTVLLEFENGEKVTTSRNAIARAK